MVLQWQLRGLEFRVLTARLYFGAAQTALRVATAENMVLLALINNNCTVPDITNATNIVRALIRARIVYEYQIRKLALAIVAWQLRVLAIQAEIQSKVNSIVSGIYHRIQDVKADWTANASNIRDDIRRAVIAWVNGTNVQVSIDTSSSSGAITVSITFDRPLLSNENLQALRDYFKKIIKSILAAHAQVNEDTDVNVNVPAPTRKRQGGNTYAATGTVGQSSSASVSQIGVVLAVVMAVVRQLL